jgi:hypothetical protein
MRRFSARLLLNRRIRAAGRWQKINFMGGKTRQSKTAALTGSSGRRFQIFSAARSDGYV